MAWYDRFTEGAVLPGVEPKTRVIDPETGRAGAADYQDTSTSARLLQGLIAFQKKQQAEEERRQKEMDKRIDMYKTLREAGYEPHRAFKALERGETPEPFREESLEKQQEEATLAKTKAETEKIKRGPARTESQRFRDAITKARRGEMSWQDLQDDYPEKIDAIKKIRKQTTKISKAPGFKAGTGGLISRIKSKFSAEMAELNAATQKVIETIQSEADIEELIKDRDDYEAEGVDVDAILEYFGRA